MKSRFSLALRYAILCFSFLSLTGCGYHLRGNYMLPDEIAKLSLTSFDKYGQLTRDVKSQFKLHGIEAVAPAENVANLHLIRESFGESTLSLYQNSRAAEYQLTYSVSYRIVVPEKGSKSYSTKVTRTFLDNPLTALAKSIEEDMIKEEMQEQAAKQIMRQLARLTAAFEDFEQLEAEESANGETTTQITTEAVDDTRVAEVLFAKPTINASN